MKGIGNGGFVFSLDSLLAILVVVLVSASYLSLGEPENSQFQSSDIRSNEAKDSIITEFYQGSLRDAPTGTELNSECVEWFEYNIEPGSNEQSVPEKIIICRGYQ